MTGQDTMEQKAQQLQKRLTAMLVRLEEAKSFAKGRYQQQVLDLCRRILMQPRGVALLYPFAGQMERAGLFEGTDWSQPWILLPTLVRNTQENAERMTVVLDTVSQLRVLAVALGEHASPGFPPEQALHFVTQVLALNLDRLFGGVDEVLRSRLGPLAQSIRELYQFLLEHVGFDNTLGSLIEEVWRILAQRPIRVVDIKAMVTQISIAVHQGSGDLSEARLGADRLVSALFGPTLGCADDPGLESYRQRLSNMDRAAIQREAYGFARAMHDVGLVSDYHAVFVRWLMEHEMRVLIPSALGLSSTGHDVLQTYQALTHRLLEEVVYPQTAQVLYGLTMLLERGILHTPPLAPGLWRQISLTLSPKTQKTLTSMFGDSLPPRVFLLAGVISLLGQPLGIGQGNNPTCQSARALSMWAYNDPDYLLHLVSQAARFDDIMMHFEGKALRSAEISEGLALHAPVDTDPVSAILVPHLDRIYNEMGRLCAGRGEDPHLWINPEFHGWWVGREFLIAVDVATGKLNQYDDFLRRLYVSYHPYYNGNQPIIHPQPAGVAVTDSAGRFVGWHAITLQRVALDQHNVMRAYFYNPNNDSGQDWGNGVIVSTQGYNERFGEASLPFDQLASRLYIFHDDPVEVSDIHRVPLEKIQKAREMGLQSWAAERGFLDE